MTLYNGIILTLLASLIGSIAASMLKNKLNKTIINYKGIFGWSIVYGIGSLIFVYALKFGELSILYPITSMTYLFSFILSKKFLNEKINKYRYISIILIIVGVILIAQ